MSAEELRRRHVTVVLALVPHLASLRADFEDAVVNEFPEFAKHPRIDEVVRDVDPGSTARYGIGGTSFLGHPSVFHSPTLRRLRREVFRTLLIEVFGDYLTGRPDLGVELLLDRIMIRPPGDQPPKESWHRDVSPWCLPGEEVFGGWLNLDEHPQYFSCLPGSASLTSPPGSAGSLPGSAGSLPGSPAPKGFVPEVAPGEGEVIEVPPGGLVLFREDILHEVVATKLKYTSVRLFHGFKVSPALGTSSLPDLAKVITTQAVPLIKSGQLPVAYPQSAVRFPLQAERVLRWREEMLTDPEGAIDTKTRAFRPLLGSHPRTLVASHPRALLGSHPRWTKKEVSSLRVSRVFFLPDRQGVPHKLTLVP